MTVSSPLLDTESRQTFSSTESYALPSNFLTESKELRFDAERYSPRFVEAVQALQASGMKLQRLAEVTHTVLIPPRFKRIYVDKEHGIPFLQGSHIVQFRLTDLKYLSLSIQKLEQWIIRAGWILVTCSGTIGRTTICPPEWDRWAASQHICRIVPDEDLCPSGYLATFLASRLGQAQLTANTYGAVVDELTVDHACNIIVPIPVTKDDCKLIASLDASMRDSVKKRSHALSLVTEAIENIRPTFDATTVPSWFPCTRKDIEDDLRFDAENYNPFLRSGLKQLEETKSVRIGDIANVFIPSRFKRVYVDEKYGLPFLQGSHVVHFQAAGLKYLWREYEHIDELLLKQGWLLVTRSGTVGRGTMCPQEWDGWAASEHVIRIVLKEECCPAGYLCAVLSSGIGQVQLTSRKHGAVVDQLTEEHVRNIIVPLLDASTVNSIDTLMRKGVSIKSHAVALVDENLKRMMHRFRDSLHTESVQVSPKISCETGKKQSSR